MDYIELNLPVRDSEHAEIMVALLSDFPFESFSEEGRTLKAYMTKNAFFDYKADVDAVLQEMEIDGAAYIEIETQNWNALWESNFQPVEVEGLCTIRAPFSEPTGEGLDVVIMPKMSFGTGHHATTYLMTAEIMKRDFAGKTGLDMGSGTGVLAVVAVKQGALHVDAVDIDDWAYENCAENIKVNNVQECITPILGNVSAVTGRHYDFILANINRNILLADMPRYVAVMNPGAELIMSGILENDVESITRKASELGLSVTGVALKDGWASVACVLD